MSLPSLALLLRAGRPVTVCARPWAQGLLQGLPLAGFVPMTGRFAQDRRAVAQALRQGGVPARRAGGLLLPDSLSSAAVFRLAGLRCGGYRDDGRSPLLAWPQPKPGVPMHAVQSWYALTRAVLAQWRLDNGPAEPPAQLGLRLLPAHRRQAAQALSEAGLLDQPFVLIAPTATGLHKGRVKVWPHFDTLTRSLQQQGVTVAMCPPPAEVDEARRNAPTALCLPALPLAAFAALLERAALSVCNDSGVSHLAAAVGAPQLTLFGVTSPARTGPWSASAACLGSEGAWPACAEVLERVQSALLQAGPASGPA
ncbi:glycosyltransferase family 9 protein [Orrella sp. JC864]|uniref:glycosyltransferase family 9 protein n=1 Tax=Orrella sp. JC864 TaxID=3120298 RepID=UPI00300B6DB4